MSPLPLAVIVAGPTASGKSALALDLARAVGGVIINADSMQVYRELRVLTARPTPDEEAAAPHRLYGVRPAAEAGHAAWWRQAALSAMEDARLAGLLPILTGGTGLYFQSLTHGIADIPPVSVEAREEARRLLAEIGPEALHAGLVKVDPATAHRLHRNDAQRIARAWEVWRTTGQGLAAWQKRRGEAAPWRFAALRLDPPREALRDAIETRFAAMLRDGALAEVAALLALGLDPALPAMRAHGVPELAAHLRGGMTLEEAGRRVELVTGQYTKRQATWFRHHELAESAATRIFDARWSGNTQDSKSFLADFIGFIRSQG
jgi:tRNA dimethylallyltransferase